MVEHLDMTLGFHVKRLLHGRLTYQYRHVAVQHVHLFLGVRHHCAGRPDTRYADDDAPHEKGGADDSHQLDFVF